MAGALAHDGRAEHVDVHAAQFLCLVHLARADCVLKHVESRTIAAILEALGADTGERALHLARTPAHDISALLGLPPALKQQFMKLLWLLAMCDGDLHSEEERLIYRIGDLIGVDRRTLARSQRFVALCLDRDGLLAGNC